MKVDMRRHFRVARLAGALWFLSWFASYLELVRYHHVTVPHRSSASPIGAVAGNGWKPGVFLQPVLMCSALITVGSLWRSRRASAHVRPR
jgi:hypothetical protein